MLRILAMVTLLLLFFATGCTVHPNSGSQAVEFNPFNWGSGEPVAKPSDGYGYADGQPLNMRK
jgi:hypothetical protein